MLFVQGLLFTSIDWPTLTVFIFEMQLLYNLEPPHKTQKTDIAPLVT